MIFFDKFLKKEYTIIECKNCGYWKKEKINVNKDVDKIVGHTKDLFFNGGCPGCNNKNQIEIRIYDKNGNNLNSIERDREAAEKMNIFNKWFEDGIYYQKKGHMNVIRNPGDAEEAYKKASECFDKALEISSDNYSAWYNKGICFQNMGNTDEAIRCYDESIKINPNFKRAFSNREMIKIIERSKK